MDGRPCKVRLTKIHHYCRGPSSTRREEKSRSTCNIKYGTCRDRNISPPLMGLEGANIDNSTRNGILSALESSVVSVYLFVLFPPAHNSHFLATTPKWTNGRIIIQSVKQRCKLSICHLLGRTNAMLHYNKPAPRIYRYLLACFSANFFFRSNRLISFVRSSSCEAAASSKAARARRVSSTQDATVA